MASLAARVRALALGLGAPGLFLVAFLDSSFLSLPEVADILVVYMVTHHKHLVIVYVMAAVLGSVCGCLVLYYLGIKGGESFIRRKFAGPTTERAIAAIQRHGMMAVLIPSILPPPMPFKIFVLLAGVVGISPARFVAAVAIGRGARYSLLGFLAIQYGDAALTFFEAHALEVSLWLVGVLVVGFLAYLGWRKVRAPKTR